MTNIRQASEQNSEQLSKIMQSLSPYYLTDASDILQALSKTASQTLSVRSSHFAVPVYEKFGFIKTSDLQYKDNLAFQPMVFTR